MFRKLLTAIILICGSHASHGAVSTPDYVWHGNPIVITHNLKANSTAAGFTAPAMKSIAGYASVLKFKAYFNSKESFHAPVLSVKVNQEAMNYFAADGRPRLAGSGTGIIAENGRMIPSFMDNKTPFTLTIFAANDGKIMLPENLKSDNFDLTYRLNITDLLNKEDVNNFSIICNTPLNGMVKLPEDCKLIVKDIELCYLPDSALPPVSGEVKVIQTLTPLTAPNSSWHGKNLKLEPAKGVSTVKTLDIPGMANLQGYMPVLKFKAYFSYGSGWLPMLSLAINGQNVNNETSQHLPRLLNYDSGMTILRNADKPVIAPTITTGAPYLLNIFYAPGGKLNFPVISGNRQLDLYYCFNISGLVKSANNKLSFTSYLKEETCIKSKFPDDCGLIIEDIELFYLPDSKLPGVAAPEIDKDALTINDTRSLVVNYKNQPLLTDETMVGVDFNKLTAQPTIIKDNNGKITANNLIDLKSDKVQFRREAAILPTGEVEVTLRTAYLTDTEGYAFYSFSVPASFLDSAQWESRNGGMGAFFAKHGILDLNKTAEGGAVFPVDEIRYLAFKKGDFKLVFDFNPLGSFSLSNVPYGGDPIGIVTTIIKKGDKVVFNITKRPISDRYAAKFRIYCSKYDYFYRHYNTSFYYITGQNRDGMGNRILFASPEATVKRNKNIQNASRFVWGPDWQGFGLESTIPGIKAGWLKLPASAKLYNTDTLPPIASGVAIDKNDRGIFTIPALPGVYTLSLTLGNPDKQVGPFNLSVNGQVALKDIEVAPNTYRQAFVDVYVPSDKTEIKIELAGLNWSVNNIIVKNVVSLEECYNLTRGFWVVPNLAEFALVVDPSRIIKQDYFTASVINAALTPKVEVREEKVSNTPPKIMPPLPPDAPAANWCWDMRLGSFDDSNAATGFGHISDNAIRERLLTLKKLGFNAVTEQGLFWNNCFLNESIIEHQKVKKNVVRIAHELGMKVIRHIDGPSFSMMGNGIQTISRFTGDFVQNIETMLASQGNVCINNPHLRTYLFERIGNYVKETGVDGVMVDEAILCQRDYCGCAYCRTKFTADTGCVLPMPGNTDTLWNDSKPLSARWTIWKNWQSAEFFQDLHDYLIKIKPDIIVTAYDNDEELNDGGNRIGYRADFLAASTDMFASEIGCGNIFANYRNFYYFRKVMRGFSVSFGRPAWGLVYPYGDAQTSGYLGWAMHAMTAQAIWMNIKQGGAYLNWDSFMPNKDKTNLANLAILFKLDERRFLGHTDKPLPFADQAGISQILTDAHIPHQIILSRDLDNVEIIKNIKTLILANANVLSQKEITGIRNFVANGGTLLISGTLAEVNDLFQPYKDPPLADVTGVKHLGGLIEVKDELLFYAGKNYTVPVKITPIEVINAEILGTFTSNSKAALTRHNFGKGVCYVSSLPLGMYNFEPALYFKQKWLYKYDAELAKTAMNIVSRVTQDEYPVKVINNLPPEVLVETYLDKNGNSAYIHLLNLTGENRYTIGEPMPVLAPKIPLSLREDIVIEIAFVASSASLASPDFKEIKSVKLEKISERKCRIIVPEDMLKTYTLITLKK